MDATYFRCTTRRGNNAAAGRTKLRAAHPNARNWEVKCDSIIARNY